MLDPGFPALSFQLFGARLLFLEMSADFLIIRGSLFSKEGDAKYDASARALRQPRVFFGDRVLLLCHALRGSTRGEPDEVAYLDLLVARSVWEARPSSARRDSKLARIHLASGRPAVAMVYLRRAFEREPGRDGELIERLLRRFRIEPASVDWFER